jgi:hypothetical protein
MFENCIIKYVKFQGVKSTIQVIYPNNPDGSHQELSIPLSPDKEQSTDYQNVMEWVAKGNTIEEAD